MIARAGESTAIEAPVPSRWDGARRAVRRVVVVAVVYLVVAGVANLLVLGGVGFARWRGHAPAVDSSWPAIDHFRRVDERLWAGAVASKTELRELRAMGFVSIVDIRKGTDAEPIDAGHPASSRPGSRKATGEDGGEKGRIVPFSYPETAGSRYCPA